MLEGKAAIVTGAARGIGRETALLMARYGAKVVVNDIGGEVDGRGEDQSPADRVVEEIHQQGGEAIANYDSVASVEGGRKIIEAAIGSFGRLDVLVNAAGIVRGQSIIDMTEDNWDAVMAVHLKGSFATIKAAAPIMREQGGGRIINFTSSTALIGNPGQANYGAAKMGIVGLTKIAALELAEYKIMVNCVMPAAWTRMVTTFWPRLLADPEQQSRRELKERLSPSLVAPLIVFLGSDASEGVTGQIFAIRGKEIILFSQPRPLRTMISTEGWSAERIAEVFLPAVRHQLYPLHVTDDVFPYDPIA